MNINVIKILITRLVKIDTIRNVTYQIGKWYDYLSTKLAYCAEA